MLTDNSLLPWITGEFDIAGMLRGAPRILTRGQFLDDVARQLDVARKSIEWRFAVLHIQLDSYDDVLAEYGEKRASRFVQSAAENIARQLQSRDRVATLGAGKMGILLEAARVKGSVQEMAVRIQDELSALPLDGDEVETLALIGVAKISASYICAEDIVNDARTAMEWSAAEEENRPSVYHRGMDRTPDDQLSSPPE